MVPGRVPGEVPGEPGGTEKLKFWRSGRQERRTLIRPPPFRPKSRQKRSPGPPQGAIWEPFFLFVRVCLFDLFFQLTFSLVFGCMWGPFWLRFCSKNRPRGPPGGTRLIMKKSLFYLWKTILFDFGGCPGNPKIDPEGVIKSDTISHMTLECKRHPKRTPT